MVLDACRYDYFKKLYVSYLNGTLEKRISSASSTTEWITKEFPNRYSDIVYVSANGFVTSTYVKLVNYDGSKHFYQVVDAWKDGWNEELGTVPPENVTTIALRALSQFKGKRFIIHYVQPHYPYIILRQLRIRERSRRNHKFSHFVWKAALKVFGYPFGNTLTNLFGIDGTDEAAVAKRIGLEAFRIVYEKNLALVLESVAELVEHLQGKVIVSADHGELLGEYGKFAHWPNLDYPELHEIPWFVVSDSHIRVSRPTTTIARDTESKEKVPAHSQEDEELIQKRLEALGYV